MNTMSLQDRSYPDFLNGLNDSQRKAAMHIDGPAIVIAGAGSGKTRVLTYRIAYMLSQGIYAGNIMALTFTNKAAREMRDRIVQQVGDEARGLWMGTFHSIFARILRDHAERLQFSPRFTIYDASDSKSLIKSIVKELGLDDKIYKPNKVASRISAAKNHLLLPAAYAANADIMQADKKAGMPSVAQIYTNYMLRLHAADAMDFDDLLLFTYLLFTHHEAVRQYYADRFRYIMVDEYQDTNYAQHIIVSQLTRGNNNICVVGDDAQSIYSFRGANIDNILRFQEHYQGATLYKLERNYRSTQNIVGAANSIIAHNTQQIRKEVYSENEMGAPLKITEAYSDLEEANIVAAQLRSWHRTAGLAYDDLAVLYRTNAQSRVFEEAFRKLGLPYRIYGGLSFYQRKEIKDVLAYFRLVINPNDEEAIKRIINYPARGIGATTLNRLQAQAIEHNASIWQLLTDPLRYQADLGRAGKKLSEFLQLIQGFIDAHTQQTASQLAQAIIRQTGLMADLLQDRTPEGISRVENVQELMNAISSYEQDRREEEGNIVVPLADYLEQVALLTDQDEGDNSEPRITLMTIHASKGLEFAGVCIVGVEAELFPNANAMLSRRELEEERRLFYVAVTRAKQLCHLSYARSRYRYGQSVMCERSRFIDEIDAQYVDDTARVGRRLSAPADATDSFLQAMGGNRSLAPTSNPAASAASPTAPRKLVSLSSATARPMSTSKTGSALVVGQRVQHERFGQGTVEALTTENGTEKATINFDHAGTKTLLLAFAKLTPLA